MRHVLPFCLVAFLALGALACGEEGGGDLASSESGLSGTCADACGGQAAGGCWCDDACAGYGDCCEDKAAVCDGTLPAPPSCEGACGGESPSGACWCDDACAGYGDCCEDKAAICDAAVHGDDGGSCEGVCGGQSAGGGCWCDALCESYGDCCEDKGAFCDGEPEPEPEPEPGPEACVRTGCSGHVCAEEHVMTTCEFFPHYVCYQQAACEVQADGACGFTKDAAFEACMAEHGADGF